MSKKNQHVVPNGKDWAVKGAGNERRTAIVNTQAEAITDCKRDRNQSEI